MSDMLSVGMDIFQKPPIRLIMHSGDEVSVSELLGSTINGNQERIALFIKDGYGEERHIKTESIKSYHF